MGDETEPLRAKAPVVPEVFGPNYNQVETDDRTDTTAQPSKFQSEVWSRDGAVPIPPGSRVVVDGREVDGDKVVIKHADVVNIYQGSGASDRDPRIVDVEDRGDRMADYPEYDNSARFRVGHLPYHPRGENPQSYHAMLRNHGNPDVVFNANIGGHRDCGDQHFRHPRFEFGHRQHQGHHGRYAGTPPFFPSHDGGPRISIGIGNRGIDIGGGVRIGGQVSFPIGGNNNGGWDGGYDQGWGRQQPSIDIAAVFNTGHSPKHRDTNYHEAQQNRRVARQQHNGGRTFQDNYEQAMAKTHRHV